MAAIIPRYLLPRGGIDGAFTQHILSRHRFLTPKPSKNANPCRHASSSSSKPRVLEKPAKFNPPSHPARLNRPPPRNYPGPPLSAAEKEAQKTRKYPHMFPNEGTFMFWFLTNRTIHLWISLGTLSTLALTTFLTSFVRTTPFRDMLPALSSFWSHPIAFLSQWTEVYRLHVEHTSAETAERRKRKVEDVKKRAEFRKAHGIGQKEGEWGWSAKDDVEGNSPTAKLEGIEGAVGPDGKVIVQGAEGEYVDFEGRRRRRPVKKWFGIW